jgi:hypothetical protein
MVFTISVILAVKKIVQQHQFLLAGLDKQARAKSVSQKRNSSVTTIQISVKF